METGNYKCTVEHKFTTGSHVEHITDGRKGLVVRWKYDTFLSEVEYLVAYSSNPEEYFWTQEIELKKVKGKKKLGF